MAEESDVDVFLCASSNKSVSSVVYKLKVLNVVIPPKCRFERRCPSFEFANGTFYFKCVFQEYKILDYNIQFRFYMVLESETFKNKIFYNVILFDTDGKEKKESGGSARFEDDEEEILYSFLQTLADGKLGTLSLSVQLFCDESTGEDVCVYHLPAMDVDSSTSESEEDSSTSEREEDGNRLQHHLSFGSGNQIKRSDNLKSEFTLDPYKYKVAQDLKELFLKQEDCDVIIKVKGREFPAHRAILKARCPVFDSAFRNDMKERKTNVIHVEDCDPSTFSDFLCFVYCGDIENLSVERVFDLFITADKYEVLDLRSKCLDFIKDNLSVETFCDTIALALKYSEAELLKFSTDFFARNLQKIIVTVKWQSFITENPISANELMIKALVPNDN